MRKWMLSFSLLLLLVFVACSGRAQDISSGNSHYNDGDYQQALDSYRDVMVANPDDPIAYFNSASVLLLGLAEFDRAVEALELAVAQGDDQMAVQAYYNMGNVFFEEGIYLDAIWAYQQALLIDPNDDDARYNLELAMQRYIPPTPTALEQQTNPEFGQSDPETTPTNEPGGFDGPTPTPPPMEVSPDPSQTPESGDRSEDGEESGTPIPQADGGMTIEQAEDLLDAVEQDQETLSQYIDDETTSGNPGEPDW